MQQHSLLQTKLYIPPIWPELVSRPRLIERLNAGLPTRGSFPRTRDAFSRALTLISAPAGFGKTTLVSEWVHEVGTHRDAPQMAWLSLDEGDNDPARFLAYLIAALRTTEANMAKGVLSALQSPQPPPPEDILTVLINEMAAIPDRIVLVLDDYHLIDAQPIHDALTFLLEHLPLQMHLAIATREDPHLPLARLRVQGRLTEVRAADLRFTSSEAAEFLNRVMGLDLSVEDIAALEARTEGWIAGLQLAAISMQGRKDASSLIKAFTGSHRFVLDYLVEEVLQQQSESVQAFLLRTSILDRHCGPLCDAVCSVGTASSSKGTALLHEGAGLHLTPSASGQELLEYLEHANLFIVPLDNERRWYRYHHLFSDLLRQRLRQTRPEWVPTLHHRASEWYERNGFNDEAIEHALRANGLRRAAHLLEEHVDALWGRGEHRKLRAWLDELPDELLFSKPHLCIFHAWYLFASGQRDAAERSLRAAEQASEPSIDRVTDISPLAQEDPLSDTDRAKLRGRTAVIRAIMDTYRGDVLGIIQHARQALGYLPEQDSTMRSIAAMALGDAHGFKGEMAAAYQARLEALEMSMSGGDTYFSIIAHLKVAITLREQGRLLPTKEICQQQMQLADESGLWQGAVVGWLLAVWGETLAELDDLEGAIRQAKRGVERTERGGDLSMLGWSYLCLMRVLFSKGDLAGADEIVQKMENTARESNVPPWITSQMAAWQARLWLAQDKLEAASEWVRERGLLAAGEPKPPHEIGYFPLIEYVVLARILIAQERLDEATKLLQRLLEAAETGERTSRVIEISSLQALASQAGGNINQAMTALERALALAEPEGFIRIFVDEGPPMARLLYEAASRGIAPGYARRLLAAFPIDELEQTGPSQTQASESELVELLSERELEVLDLIAEGLTNQEISARLFLSLNTIKGHTRNIYGKLGVHSRTQAVARASAFGILPPI
jgi:LuxR family maltose regulon positive regulatory protein